MKIWTNKWNKKWNKKNIDCSIILINRNNWDVIFDCIESLRKTIKKWRYEIIVVDNNSEDGSRELIEEKYKDITLIKNTTNTLFAHPNNQWAEVAKGKYLFILNSDTVALEWAVDSLVTHLEETGDDIVTCTLLNKDKTIQYNMHRSFPSFLRIFFSFLYVKKKRNFLKNMVFVNKYLLLDNKFDQDFYVDQAAWAAILISRNLVGKLEKPLLDEENFPLLFNDADLCYRVSKVQWKILCKTNVQIIHLKSVSIKKFDFLKLGAHYWISWKNFFKKHRLRIDFILFAFTGYMLALYILVKVYSFSLLWKISKKELKDKRNLAYKIIKWKI